MAGHIEGNCFSSIFLLLSLSRNSQELQCWFQIFYTLSVGYSRLLLSLRLTRIAKDAIPRYLFSAYTLVAFPN